MSEICDAKCIWMFGEQQDVRGVWYWQRVAPGLFTLYVAKAAMSARSRTAAVGLLLAFHFQGCGDTPALPRPRHTL